MTHPDDIQGWLEHLGKAHQDGALSSDAARYPWRTVELAADRPTLHRFAWVRVAGPLAAAAVVAILFVVPSLSTAPLDNQVADKVVESVTPEGPKAIIIAEGPTDPHDYNGDGRVDGRDIAAYMDHLRSGGEDVGLETERFRDSMLQT